MKIIYTGKTFLLFFGVAFLNFATSEEFYKSGPLFLSPYISQGKLEEARRDSKVNVNSFLANPITSEHIESYSGYLTVNSNYNSNLFFWFFPAQENPLGSPLVLFLVGGPGAPCTSEVFLNGPLVFDDNGNVHIRDKNLSWARTQSVIYLDSPVGSGFSFTDDPKGYSKNDKEIAENIFVALLQFFQIFSTYKSLPFYIAGLSDGGKFATTLAHKIQQTNQQGEGVSKIHLKGLLLLSPLLDPVVQSRLAHVHYKFGLIDEETRTKLETLENAFAQLVTNNEIPMAAKLIDDMYGVNFNTTSIFNQKSGYESIYEGLLNPRIPCKRLAPRDFIKQSYIRNAIHAGNYTFLSNSPTVVLALLQDIFVSVSSKLESLLASRLLKIWIVNGQLDLAVPSANIDVLLKNLNWTRYNEFYNTEQVVWTSEGDITGYFKCLQHFRHVLVRLAGHIIYFDELNWSADLLSKFVR